MFKIVQSGGHQFILAIKEGAGRFGFASSWFAGLREWVMRDTRVGGTCDRGSSILLASVNPVGELSLGRLGA